MLLLLLLALSAACAADDDAKSPAADDEIAALAHGRTHCTATSTHWTGAIVPAAAAFTFLDRFVLGRLDFAGEALRADFPPLLALRVFLDGVGASAGMPFRSGCALVAPWAKKFVSFAF